MTLRCGSDAWSQFMLADRISRQVMLDAVTEVDAGHESSDTARLHRRTMRNCQECSQKKTIPNAVPRFCPNCKNAAPEDHEDPLCPECGDRLIPQGYCPVCEHFWRLAVDVLCPKHDIPLEAGPPPSSEPITTDQVISWVTVKVFPDSLSAAIPRSRLEAEGIRTFLAGERMGARPCIAWPREA